MNRFQNLRKTVFEINLFALAKNYAELRNELGPTAFFCPMVKANAYGHGDVAVSRMLVQLGCTHVGVALIEEGIKLRTSQIACDILVFGHFGLEGARALVEFELTPVVSSFEDLEALKQALNEVGEQQFPVHVKFDTGMKRMGFDLEEALQVANYFRSNPQMTLKGICTHLSHAEDAGDPKGRTTESLEQFRVVEKIFSDFHPITHVYNSAGLINVAQTLKQGQKLPPSYRWPDGARPGIGFYGYDVGARRPHTIKLEPAARLKSQVIKYHELKKGESVSYGGIWTAPQPATIAVVPIGYGDGYPRQLSNRASVLFRGYRVPVVGRVCMDYLMIDVTPFTRDNLQIGEEVVLMGGQGESQITIEELSDLLGTIPYTVLTGISERVRREYIQQ